MVDTRFGILDDQRDRLAKLYGYSDAGGFVETVEFSPRLIPSPIPRGGFGLISTAPDYLQFAQMLLSKGELGDVRLLGRKTVEYITRNHLPKELIPIELAPGYSINGYGYGILFGIMIDAVQASLLGSEGEYYWGGLSTIFGIDPKEQLIFLLMTRLEYPGHFPIYYTFRTLVYQTIIE
jgi:CubicO group peptidase (beta-lactamase class C family)